LPRTSWPGRVASPLIGIIWRSARSARIDAVNAEAADRGEKADLSWPGWYSLRRFHGTAVRAESNLETTSRALGNSQAVADKHYVKPSEVLPDVRKAVNDAVSGLTDVQRAGELMTVSYRKYGGGDGTRTRGLCRDSLGIHGLSATYILAGAAKPLTGTVGTCRCG